jgi:o-succinylbenzoate---CoA ligase
MTGGTAPWGRSGPGLALVDVAAPGRPSWIHDQLTVCVEALAERLRAQGLSAGQLVAVPERPGVGLVLMQHALPRAGAALLPLRGDADDPGARTLLAATGAEWRWQPDGADGGQLVRLAAADPGAAMVAEVRGWPSPLALVVETSGSSGPPRAAMLTQGNLVAAALLGNQHLGLGPGDAWLCCLPLRHVGGLSITYRCALAGATLRLHRGFDAAAVAADLALGAVTHLSLVPPMLARLLAHGQPPPPSLRVLLVGGQSLGQSLARQAIAAGWPLHVTYGMTETASQFATSGRLLEAPVPGEIGPPLAGLDLDCPDCAEGPGRLRVRGAVVMAGYANPRRRPGDGLADGWFCTSDLACRGPDGLLHVLGRADEVLITGGVKVHPAGVESLLAGAPGVLEAAVVGVADPIWGHRLVAVYRGDAAPAALDAWCRERLAAPQRPRAFLSCVALPVLESGKLDRGRLRELAAGVGHHVEMGES